MRILHVNKFLYRRGGAESYMLDLAALQSAQGHQVAYFGMEHQHNTETSVGGEVPFLDFQDRGILNRAKMVRRMFWSRLAERSMSEAIEEFRPDIVHAHNIYHQLSPSVLAAAEEASVPVVMTLHDYKLVCPTYQFLDRGMPCMACMEQGPIQAAKRACLDGSRFGSALAALEVGFHRWKNAYEVASALIAPSVFLADVVRSVPAYRELVHTVPNFARPSSSGGNHERRDVLFVGRLSNEKGLAVLLNAVLRLERRGLGGQIGVLHIIGEGPEETRLRSLASAIPPGRLVFHGRLSQDGVDDYMQRARVLVVPSIWFENMPIVVLEAFTAGVPVIATRMGGLPEMVDESVGWLVEANSPEQLGDALLAAATDPEGTARRGVAAQIRAETMYSPAQHVGQIIGLYNHVTGIKGA